ncbi:hypothetical protein JOF29_000086 [Kribbella aluminosa]|uniref:DUF4158 domain-containing protein n=1 Tax=Kribbella aluminosa TaxID=416017 RepID=A0ABS4UBI4_9ACTN|nr:DUF4158 domain-containing protein [Kribbella aluminosa]MBP2349003.1 hypothetical protein [Kribbella aluminosa]
MRREWSSEDRVSSWTLVEEDRALVANRSGATRLGVRGVVKFFEIAARFPRSAEVPTATVSHVADQVKVDFSVFASHRP